MGKELVKEWFSHDCGTRNDPDMIPLLEDFKGVGYGIYWSTVELLHERHGSLPLNENTFKAIGKPIGEKSLLVSRVIEKCINTYELFFKDGDRFTANRVHRNLSVRQKSIEQRSNAGKASAAKRQRSLNDNPTVVERNSTKKGKKGKKGEEITQREELKINPDFVKAPPTEQEVVESFVRAGGSVEQAKKFFDKYSAIGWKINRNPIVNWVSLIRSFLDTWKEISDERQDSDKPKMIYA